MMIDKIDCGLIKPKSHTTRYTGIEHNTSFEVDAKPKDIVIFHAALLHQGGNMKGDRISMFWAFGKDNKHSKYHSMAAMKRQINQNRDKKYFISNHLSKSLEVNSVKYKISNDEYEEFSKLTINSEKY